jgi:hypothetical protein
MIVLFPAQVVIGAMAKSEDMAARTASLAELERVQAEWRELEARRLVLLEERTAAIMRALDAGNRLVDVAEAAEISRGRLHRIREARRGS